VSRNSHPSNLKPKLSAIFQGDFFYMPRSIISRILLTTAGLFMIYAVGQAFRLSYGTRVVVRNESKETLHNVNVRVEHRGGRYYLPDLQPGQRKRVFVKAVGESSIMLEFMDSKNIQRTAMIAGYVESDYCGTTTAIIHDPGRIEVHDDTFGVICWKSWFEFL
jgi:hypothetical protein